MRELILEAVNEGGASLPQVQMIDSTIIQAHHHQRAQKGDSKEGFGRSKGGFAIKIHLITNVHGLPVCADITGREDSDYKGYDLLADADMPPSKLTIADRGYDSGRILDDVERRGGTPVIPGKKNRKQPIKVDRFIYALRNRIERCNNKLKCARRLATRYDKTAANQLAII